MTIMHYGKHKVTNASIADTDIDNMLQNERVSILYSDPPWGDGNLNYWATMNQKMNGQKVTQLTYDQLIFRLNQLIHTYVDGYVFIETGVRWENELAKALEQTTKEIKIFRTLYRSGSRILENSLIAGVTNARYHINANPTGMTGYPVPLHCIQSCNVSNGVVLDPCCGLGYTARAAIECNLSFRGNEFNLKRLQKTIAILQKSR